jgi:hypothetical protein
MPESVPSTHDTIKLSQTTEGGRIEAPSAIEDTAVLNDEVMIEIAPDRACGTMWVRLAYAGPSMPLLADDLWAE